MDNLRKPLQILGIFVYTPMWKKENVIHGFPQDENPTKFSTGRVDKEMFIMWITSWIMWIVGDIHRQGAVCIRIWR